MPSMTEAELRARVVDIAHQLGWRVFSLPIAKTRRPVKDAVGYPDLTLARRGEVIWVELKADNGVTTPAQLAWWKELPEGRCYFVRPADIVWLAMKLGGEVG